MAQIRIKLHTNLSLRMTLLESRSNQGGKKARAIFSDERCFTNELAQPRAFTRAARIVEHMVIMNECPEWSRNNVLGTIGLFKKEHTVMLLRLKEFSFLAFVILCNLKIYILAW